MPVKLYHRSVYAPAPMFRSPGVVRLEVTHHARQAAKDDRYGDLSKYLRHYLDFDATDIVEVEVTDGVITKRTVRLPVTPDLVLVLVVSGEGRVITVWGNRRDDDHATLNTKKFVQPRATVADPRRSPAPNVGALALC